MQSFARISGNKSKEWNRKPWNNKFSKSGALTLKAPIKTAADDIHKYLVSVFFRENKT